MPIHKGLFYNDEGAGPAVLLIHGFCESSQVWKEIIPMLKDKNRLIAIDVPGFGKSKLPDDAITMPGVAKTLVTFMEQIGVATYTIVGHSMGGYIMLEMVRLARERIRGCSLFHSTALPDTDEKKVSRNKVIDFVERHGVAQFIESFIPPLFSDRNHPLIGQLIAQASMTSIETVIRYTAAMRDRNDGTALLREIKMPVLFVAGSNDPGITPEVLYRQAEMTQTARFEVAGGVGHMGMLENPTITGEFLRQFLSDMD